MSVLAERIAEKPEGGRVLLEMLDALGWSVAVMGHGRGGFLVVAMGFGRRMHRAEGDTLADAALELYRKAEGRG